MPSKVGMTRHVAQSSLLVHHLGNRLFCGLDALPSYPSLFVLLINKVQIVLMGLRLADLGFDFFLQFLHLTNLSLANLRHV